jgi:hypothetical protein
MNKKKILIVVTAFLMTATAYAQEKEPLGETDSQKRLHIFNEVKKHEVSIDVVAALAITSISPRYEYVLGRYSGVGVDLFLAVENDDVDFDEYEHFSLTPYYRQYFFSKEDYGAKGFYGEGFVKFYAYKSGDSFSDSNNNFVPVGENFFETALGVGIGWKWVSDSGFLIDLGFGLGRNLGLADDPYRDAVQVRGGLNFGWRF